MRFILLLSVLGLVGCDEPMVAGCERYVKASLMAPSTYERVLQSGHSRSSSWEEIRSNGGMVFDWGEHDVPEPWVHFVKLEYRAHNAFGVPTDREVQCLFQTIGPDKPIEMNVDIAVSRAIRLKKETYSKRLKVEKGRQIETDNQVLECCL